MRKYYRFTCFNFASITGLLGVPFSAAPANINPARQMLAGMRVLILTSLSQSTAEFYRQYSHTSSLFAQIEISIA